MTRGEIMRMHRERAGLSQYELADLSGVTQKTIWALEHDKNNGTEDIKKARKYIEWMIKEEEKP